MLRFVQLHLMPCLPRPLEAVFDFTCFSISSADKKADKEDDKKKSKKEKEAEPEEKKASKKGSKDKEAEKEEKGDKKKSSKKAEPEPEPEEPKKKSKKADKEAAAEAPAAEDKKSKKSSKKDKEEAPAAQEAAPAAPEPAASPAAEAPAAASAVEEAPAAAAPAPLVFGEPAAAAPAWEFDLCRDKVVRLSFSIAITPGPGFASSAAPEPGIPYGTATITIKAKPRSTRKPCDYVDCAVLTSADPAVATVATTVRIATSLEAKSKDKGVEVSQSAAMAVPIADPHAPLALPLRFSYQVAGTTTPVSMDALLRIPAAALVVPVAVEAEAYRNLMTSEGAAFAGAEGLLPVAPGVEADVTLATSMGILRSYAVARSPKHAILYARTLAGSHVTALLKAGPDGRSVVAGVKAIAPGLAPILLAELTEALTAVAAAAADAAKEEKE